MIARRRLGGLWAAVGLLALGAAPTDRCWMTKTQILDGVPGEFHEGSLRVTSDGRHFAYVVDVSEEGLFHVVDGKKEPVYEKTSSIRFSKEGGHHVYAAKRGEDQFVVVDGREGPPFPTLLADDSFSRDGQHYAYAAQRHDGLCVVVADGVAQKPYPLIHKVVLSPDGQRLAYAALGANGWCVVVDGVEGKGYDGIEVHSPTFSPDGQQVGYWAMRRDKWFCVVDDKEYGEFDRINSKTPLFSPEGKHFAICFGRRGKWAVILDGQEGNPYDAIVDIGFSQNGDTLAFLAYRASDKLSRLVMNGVESEGYNGFAKDSLVVSPDGSRAAFVTFPANAATCVVLDGKMGPPFDEIDLKTLSFSPDSKHFVFVGRLGGSRYVVLDGVTQASYDALGSPIFSPDSRHLAYAGIHGRVIKFVIDGQEIAAWPHTGDGALGFAGNDSAWAIYARKDQIFRIDARLMDRIEGEKEGWQPPLSPDSETEWPEDEWSSGPAAEPEPSAEPPETEETQRPAPPPAPAATPADVPAAEPPSKDAATPTPDAEQKARGKLQLAEMFEKQGLTDAARREYRRLVEQYPDTESTKVARERLKALGEN